jgi:hypothetical protein
MAGAETYPGATGSTTGSAGNRLPVRARGETQVLLKVICQVRMIGVPKLGSYRCQIR